MKNRLGLSSVKEEKEGLFEICYFVSSGFIRYLEIVRVMVIFQGSIDAALMLPITHTSVRQVPPATANCKQRWRTKLR